MAPKKIVVFGVTGTQGGSVARALLEQGDEFEVWGVSRSRSSKKAQGE
jgi:nucleoside-diphosphate-sugar epimerase